jgi:hypothetical protein
MVGCNHSRGYNNFPYVHDKKCHSLKLDNSSHIHREKSNLLGQIAQLTEENLRLACIDSQQRKAIDLLNDNCKLGKGMC